MVTVEELAWRLLAISADCGAPGQPGELWLVRQDIEVARRALDALPDVGAVARHADDPTCSVPGLLGRCRAARDELELMVLVGREARGVIVDRLVPAHLALRRAVNALLVIRDAVRGRGAPVAAGVTVGIPPNSRLVRTWPERDETAVAGDEGAGMAEVVIL